MVCLSADLFCFDVVFPQTDTNSMIVTMLLTADCFKVCWYSLKVILVYVEPMMTVVVADLLVDVIDLWAARGNNIIGVGARNG